MVYDGKLQVMKHALGTHTTISRVQGNQLKASREIRIASVFRDAPADFLKMIVVHASRPAPTLAPIADGGQTARLAVYGEGLQLFLKSVKSALKSVMDWLFATRLVE